MCWTYDSFGNRTSESSSRNTFDPACNTSNPNYVTAFTFNTKNQIIATSLPSLPQYDPNGGGNLINDGSQQYLYDAENRICAVQKGIMAGVGQMFGYIYDADGNRVAKGTISSWSCDTAANGFQVTSTYALNLQGQTVTENAYRNGASSWVHTDLFAEGQLMATYDPNGLHFQIADWLGTRRVQTDALGQIEQTCQSLPFGNGLGCTPAAGAAQDATERHFTGKERDVETGLDYFGARYLSSNMGRWMSPDPSMEGAILELPQTWNKYSYEYNRPTYGTDPDGRCPPCFGALIGGAVEGGFDAGKQFINNGYSFSGPGFNGKEVLANIAGGAVAGAIAGATGGASIVANAFIGDVAAGATSNIVGSIVTRALDPNASSEEVMSAVDVSEDALAGFVGGAGGHVAADLVHIPGEPRTVRTRSGSVYRRQMANRQAAMNTRNLAILNQFVRAGVTSSLATHSTNGLFDWLMRDPPPPCFSTSARDSFGNNTGSSGCQ